MRLVLERWVFFPARQAFPGLPRWALPPPDWAHRLLYRRTGGAPCCGRRRDRQGWAGTPGRRCARRESERVPNQPTSGGMQSGTSVGILCTELETVQTVFLYLLRDFGQRAAPTHFTSFPPPEHFFLFLVRAGKEVSAQEVSSPFKKKCVTDASSSRPGSEPLFNLEDCFVFLGGSTKAPQWMVLHPTNNALLRNFRLSSDAEVLPNKHRPGMPIDAKHAKKHVCNVYYIPTGLPFCTPPLVVGFWQSFPVTWARLSGRVVCLREH